MGIGVGSGRWPGPAVLRLRRPAWFVTEAVGLAGRLLALRLVLAGGCAVAGAVAAAQGACVGHGPLKFGFYAFFEPLSYSVDEGAGFNTHRGYEADLVDALERLEDAGLRFSRHGIRPWPGIWLRSEREFDVVGGGITILPERTMDAAGRTVVQFTAGHVAFRQSLLVRAGDAARYAAYADLTSAVRVGVLAGTTGEARLLQLVGLAQADGSLIAGTRVETAAGEVIADGSDAYQITAAVVTENLAGRQRLHPPDATRPQVIYLGDEAGEQALLDALAAGTVDAVARGEIGNRVAAGQSNGAFAVTAIDPQAEYGGFTVRADRTRLLACLDERIAWLTAGGGVGYAEWQADAGVFRQRADLWNGLATELQDRGRAAIGLDALFAHAGRATRYQATSSESDLVSVRVADGSLQLVLDQHTAGVATVTVTAAASDGTATTLTFEVAVQPVRLWLRGWRNALGQRDG